MVVYICNPSTQGTEAGGFLQVPVLFFFLIWGLLLLFLFCVFNRVSFSSPGCLEIHSVAQASLKLVAILLLQYPEY